MSENEQKEEVNIAKMRRETEEYLKKIHQTIKDSKNLLTELDLRVAETDKFLAEQGLTREQVMGFKFSPEQIKVVNEEFKRRGLPPLEETFGVEEEVATKKEPLIRAGGMPPSPDPAERDGTVENRQRKFGAMMQQFKM